MKTNLIILSAGLALCSFLLQGCVEIINGEMTNKEINNPELIKGIVADGPWDVTVFQSETPNAYIEYNDSYRITAEVRNDGYLHLKINTNKHKSIKLKKNFRAVVEIPYIKYIKASSVSEISLNGRFEGDFCKIDLSGASKVKHFDYYGNTLELDIDEVSNCNMSGKGDHVKISGSDASEIKMFNFTTETLDVNLKDVSNVEITVNKRITGKLSDASELKYRGNANVSEVKTGDLSRVKKR